MTGMREKICAGIVAAAIATLTAGRALAQGCAMCATALGGPDDPLSSGINASIFFMMSMPFVLFAAVGGWMAYMYRRGQSVMDDAATAAQRPELRLLRTEREGAR